MRYSLIYGFASAAQLFAELRPSRMVLLEAIQRIGPISVPALAEQIGCEMSTVQADADKLIEHDLVHTDANGRLFVPWEQVQLRVNLPAGQALRRLGAGARATPAPAPA